MVSWYGDCQRPACPRLSFFVWVNRCMCVVLSHTKNGFPSLCWRLMKSPAAIDERVVAGFHSLLRQGTRIGHFLLADATPAWFLGWIVRVGRPGVNDAAGSEILAEIREVLLRRVVGHFRLFLGVEVIEIAEELVEPVHGGQELVAVAQVVLAELAGRVAGGFSSSAIVGSSVCKPDGAREPDLGQAGTERHCPVMNDARPAVQLCSTVRVREHHSFPGNPVDVGRS